MSTENIKGRIEGIDMARALALLGMLAVHFGPEDDGSVVGTLYALPHGRASILFIVVAGIGVSLLSRSDATRAQIRLAAFALVLLPLGLLLELLDNHVAVILHHYAAFFLLGAAMLRLSTNALLGCAATMTMLGPAVYFAGRAKWPELFDRESVSLVDDPLSIGQALLFSGPYPLLTWAAPLLWGMYLGRQDMRSRGLAPTLLGIGTAVAVGVVLGSNALLASLGTPTELDDWRMLLTTSAHSEMPLWVLQAMASASAVLGLCLVLARVAGWLVAPFAALGRVALTVYVLHLLVLAAWPGLLNRDAVQPALLSVLAFGGLAMAGAVLWQPMGRGPLEAIMHALAARMGNLAPKRSEADDGLPTSGGKP